MLVGLLGAGHDDLLGFGDELQREENTSDWADDRQESRRRL